MTLTIEERCAVDAVSFCLSSQVPHLVKWDALRKAYNHTDDCKGGKKTYCTLAKIFELLDDRWDPGQWGSLQQILRLTNAKIKEQNRYLDGVDDAVVYDFDHQRRSDLVHHLIKC